MAGSVRATCPNCQNTLTIPKAWADKAFKCKNCGAVIKGIPTSSLEEQPAMAGVGADAATPGGAPSLPPGLADASMPGMPAVGSAEMPAMAPPAAYAPPAYPAPMSPPTTPAPMGGVYPQIPGYPPAPGYAPPAYPGAPAAPYGYAPPPGYPAPPAGYPAPYPGAPGYAPPAGYAAPVAYPDPYAATGMPPAAMPAAAMPPAPAPAAVPVPPMPNPAAPRRRPTPETKAPIPNAETLNLPEPTFGAGRERRRKKNSMTATIVWVGLGLFLTGGLIAGGIYGSKLMKSKPPGTSEDGDKPLASTKGTSPGSSKSDLGNRHVSSEFPRRMLVLNVTKYLFANGLTSGKGRTGDDYLSTLARQIAFQWYIPDNFRDPNNPKENQTFMVSDTSKDARPMFKDTIQKSYEQFFNTSRKQDRILIYYGGHAIEKDGKAYLVPVDGDLENVETLLPLDDFWEKLKACPAQQKVVFFDVCRLNEDGDTIRPGSEAMSEGLEKALHSPPPGVQVVSSCSANQNANEFRRTPGDATEVAGSLFLSEFKYVADKGRAKPPKPMTPNDPFPVAQWVAEVSKRVTEVSNFTTGRAQTVKFTDSPNTGTLAANPAEPPASRFSPPPPPVGMKYEEVAKLTKAVELPPIRPSAGAGLGDDEPIAKVIPFNPELMKDFKFDGEPDDEILKQRDKYPMRAITVEAIKYIHAHWGGTGDDQIRTHFVGETDDGVKALVTKEQELPAIVTQDLDDIHKRMEKLAGDSSKEESKYWRVTFLYAFAQVKSRMAFMEEYNYALAAIKTEALPERKKGEIGYQLVSTTKSKGKVRELAESAKETFTQIEDEYKGTPWAIQAKRAKVVSLGLKWVPYSAGAKVDE